MVTNELTLNLAAQADRLAPEAGHSVKLSQLMKGDIVRITQGDSLRMIVTNPVLNNGIVECRVLTEAGLTYSWSAPAAVSVLLVERTLVKVAA